MGLHKHRASDLPQTLLMWGQQTARSRSWTLEGNARGHTLEKASRKSWKDGPTGFLMSELWWKVHIGWGTEMREDRGPGEPRSRSRRRVGWGKLPKTSSPTFFSPPHCWLTSQFPLKGVEQNGPGEDSKRKAESVWLEGNLSNNKNCPKIKHNP